MTPDQRKRNGRVLAVVLALSVIISLVFLSYAFLQRENAKKEVANFQLKITDLESQLQKCAAEAGAAMAEADRQRAVAEKNMAIAMAQAAAAKK